MMEYVRGREREREKRANCVCTNNIRAWRITTTVQEKNNYSEFIFSPHLNCFPATRSVENFSPFRPFFYRVFWERKEPVFFVAMASGVFWIIQRLPRSPWIHIRSEREREKSLDNVKDTWVTRPVFFCFDCVQNRISLSFRSLSLSRHRFISM